MKQEHYYRQMNKSQQAAYYAMMEGFLAISPEFDVPRLENRDLTDIFFRLRLDHPEIFYVNTFSYRFTDIGDSVRMTPRYMFEKKKILEHRKALDARVTRLVRQAQGLTPLEKELFIHDFITSNVTYDKLKKQYSHEIIGPLAQGIGVCEGIAKTVKILCDRLGLGCIIAVSDADPDNGVRYRHAWNLIELDGKWYHMDATFDNSLGRYGAKRFDYFNLSDRQIFADHRPSMYLIPECGDSRRGYYIENRLALTKTEDVGKRLKAVVRKGQPHFVFQWRGGYLNRDILGAILEEAAQAAAEGGKEVYMSMNPGQMVIELTLKDNGDGGSGESRPAICVEQADEGDIDERERMQ
ncbi:transglutaminase domain-containing protein [Catenibacillus scindens]|uniref:transglutaminase domain-containing protein n=1 Tax=Catenibacillus scindens TaxID=673271 RepID=UPI0032078C79